jgi:hypothetical protein
VFSLTLLGVLLFMGDLGRQAPGGILVFLIGKGNESRHFDTQLLAGRIVYESSVLIPKGCLRH